MVGVLARKLAEALGYGDEGEDFYDDYEREEPAASAAPKRSRAPSAAARRAKADAARTASHKIERLFRAGAAAPTTVRFSFALRFLLSCVCVFVCDCVCSRVGGAFACCSLMRADCC